MDKNSISSYSISDKTGNNSGFTLLEVLVVVIIVGILSAIAAPGWLAFTQRQRLNKSNDIVLSAIQDAQREAKKKKLSYSVTFAVDRNNNQSYFAVYRTRVGDKFVDVSTKNFSDRTYWTPLGEDVGVNPEEIWLGSASKNSNLSRLGTNKNQMETITFNYLGIPEEDIKDKLPIKIVPAVPSVSNKSQASDTKKCVILETILGGTRIGENDECT